jgi:dTDP-4-dehydrorhamnose reductase
MKLLLLGNTGQLGWELQRTMQPLGEGVALDTPEINMADADNIRKVVREHCPQVIVNATAYTAVDQAESEPELAHAINASGPGVLAEEARKLKAALIHYSTDYVFDGAKGTPYVETDLPHPINVYGQSKLAGEQAIQAIGGVYLILRTAWAYSLRRESFLSKLLQWVKQNETLRIVDDEIGTPTWARLVAEASAQILAQGVLAEDFLDWFRQRKGIYHMACQGSASRADWAELALSLFQANGIISNYRILPVKSDLFNLPAKRPKNSSLNSDLLYNTFGLRLPHWKVAIPLALN